MRNATETASIYTYDQQQFIVTMPYGPAVCEHLRSVLNVDSERMDSRELDLSLIELPRPRKWARAISKAATARIEKQQRETSVALLAVHGPIKVGASPLDDLMFCVRYDFAENCYGWIPPMGKNRYLQNVAALPHIDPGLPHSLISGAAFRPKPVSTLPSSDADPERGKRVRVGILDTALYQHSALAGHYLARPADLLVSRASYPYLAGHSAFIAGLVLHHAPAAELHIRQVLSEDHATTTVWKLADEMVALRDSGVQILNLSLGCYTPDGQPPMVLDHAIRRLSPDVVIVAAAGNHGDAAENKKSSFRPRLDHRMACWPAAFDNVVAVGANLGPDHMFALAPFTPRLPWVTFTAQGTDVVSMYFDGPVEFAPDADASRYGGYASWDGTSFAAATVSGELAALMTGGTPVRQALDELTNNTRSTVRPYEA